MLGTDDLVTGDNCFFVATGVTSGDLLRGRALPGRRGVHAVDRDALQERHHPGDRLVPPAGEAGALLGGRLRRSARWPSRSDRPPAQRRAGPVRRPPDRRRRRWRSPPGVAVAVQSRINGELGVRLEDGIAAAVVSFGVGLLVLAGAGARHCPAGGAGCARCAARWRDGRRCGRGSASAASAARSWSPPRG